MAVPDGWPPARFGGFTESGLQAPSPAAQSLTCGFALTARCFPDWIIGSGAGTDQLVRRVNVGWSQR